MKKITLTLLLASFIGFTVTAQELVSKKGEPYLPEAGDWALGIDIAPFFEYVGNSANGNVDNAAPGFEYAYPLQVFGKWFKTEDLAWRGRIRFLGVNNNTQLGYVQDDLNTDPSNPYKQVEDQKKTSRMSTTLAFGIEKRKGKTRLQGFYGGEVVLSFSSGSDKYSYGNALTGTNINPTTFTFDNVNTSPPNGYRVTEINYGTGFSFGVRPFIGAEYFLFPKMSLGGEFGYTIGFNNYGAATITSEYYNFTDATTKTNTQEGSYYKSAFRMDNDNLSGSIKLMLHF